MNPAIRPVALLLATQPWPVAAKLGLALEQCGFALSLWAPRGNFLLKTGIVKSHYLYRAFGPESTLEEALIACHPALIVPCDEPAMAALQRVAAGASLTLRAILAQTFGRSEELARVNERAFVLQAAAEGGALVPEQAPISDWDELHAWLSQYGFPAYLKADGTFGAMGVRRIQSYEQAKAAFQALKIPPPAGHTFRRFAMDRDPSLVDPFLRRQPGVVSVQRAVSGRDANSAFFCWRGRVLARLTMEVVAVSRDRGPSTALRRIHNPAMDRAADILAERLQLSGFYGLDFILEEQTGRPWLLEMNSRATQIPHLALGEGHDLAAAAYAAVTGEAIRPRPVVTDNPVIALFPQEWSRDPNSELLKTAHHDVPWESPALVAAMLKQGPTLLSRLTRSYWKKRRNSPYLKPLPAAVTALHLP